MKHLILVVSILLSFSYAGNARSMYKVTTGGKTVVGNNEDWVSPNSQFWYVPAEEQQYGVMYMGLLNNFAQGAINEAGLMFDGFANPYLEVNNTEGKINIPIGEAVQHAMHSFSNVREVKKYFATINLSSLVTGQLVFVDKIGEYLIVEGDELIIGNDTEKVFSNFYYSQIDNIKQVELKNVQNGLQFLKNTTAEGSVDYCSDVMENISNVDGLTQYSTIYDLDQLTIRVYLFHDYSQFVEIDLKEELAKGAHRSMIADLFPHDSKGYQHYLKYNDPDNPNQFVMDWIGDNTLTEDDLVENGFAGVLNTIGYEWLYDKKDVKGAIQVFQYATALMPNEANLHDSLGEAYFTNENYEEAIKSYANSLVLNPNNTNAIEMLDKIRKEQ
ncbi:MAG: tetratricopeptide repeat protein [Bacteroidota bacterium]